MLLSPGLGLLLGLLPLLLLLPVGLLLWLLLEPTAALVAPSPLTA